MEEVDESVITLIQSSSALLAAISKQKSRGDIPRDVETMIDALIACALNSKFKISPDARTAEPLMR